MPAASSRGEYNTENNTFLCQEEYWMGQNVVQKIFSAHIVEGQLKQGETIALRVDQVLTQDATGTMAYLQFEAIGVPRIKTPLAVSYVDHNMLQTDFRNPDDHLYLQTAAAKYGAFFSKPGNGICHQVHLERFARPGVILIGSDSHTVNAGGMGMIAMGTGGLDIATVMAGAAYEITMPKVLKVELIGELKRPWSTAMEVIMELLRVLTVKGGVGRIVEYSGPGVKTLSLTERATITNMGAELGATTSIFPSDEITKRFLDAQGRGDQWVALSADPDATYDEEMVIDLSTLEPMVCQPHSPDNVVKVKELTGKKVEQVCIGSCTNSSYHVMRSVASLLDGRTVHPRTSLAVNPGSKQVYEMIASDGSLAKMVAAGARMLESSCGPCIGMGQTPSTSAVSVRSYNRNFKGRSGNETASVYLANPVVATAIALRGEMFDPNGSDLVVAPFTEPDCYAVNDNLLLAPVPGEDVEVIKGPNIKPVPTNKPLGQLIHCEVALKVDNNISTDEIMPAGSDVLPLRSNIPAISEYVFYRVDKHFAKRAKALQCSIVVGGENYGQGSSREHAALAPMYLGVKAIIAKSFARIHHINLINFGILPLTFTDPNAYEAVEQGHELFIDDVLTRLDESETFVVRNLTTNSSFEATVKASKRDVEILKAGGLLPYTKLMHA